MTNTSLFVFSSAGAQMYKPERMEWEHFEAWLFDKDGKVVQVQCKYCPWKASHHATRVAKHYYSKHAHRRPLTEAAVAEDEEEEVAQMEEDTGGSESGASAVSSKRQRLTQQTLLAYGDRSFSQGQQALAERIGHPLQG